MQNLKDFRPAIDVLHRMLFEAISKQSETAEMDEIEDWIESRVSAYSESFNATTGEPSADRILAVGRKFSEFIGLADTVKYTQECFLELVTSPTLLYNGVHDFLTKYRIKEG